MTKRQMYPGQTVRVDVRAEKLRIPVSNYPCNHGYPLGYLRHRSRNGADIRSDIAATDIRPRSLLRISVVARIIRQGYPWFHGYPSEYLQGQFDQGNDENVFIEPFTARLNHFRLLSLSAIGPTAFLANF